MNKYISLFLTFVLIVVFITGCSEGSNVDETHNNTTDVVTSVDSTSKNDALTPPIGDYTYIQKGDTVSDYFKYSFADYGMPDEYSMDGYEGLEYTFDNVTVYESVSASPIKYEACEKNLTDYSDAELYENNSFILIDMTATYNKPENSDRDRIMFRMEFEGIKMSGEGYEEHNPKEFLYPYTEPKLMYFSERPQEGDVDLDGNALSLSDDGNVCRTALSSGDSLKFQIGILAKKDLVDEKNVFLFLRKSETPEKGNPVPLVDVLGRYDNE